MNQSLFHPSWYRVAKLKPSLRQHVRICRHVYRGQVWFVVRNNIADKTHRFTPIANQIISRLNGDKAVDEIWMSANARLGELAVTQGQVIQLLAQLHGADLLQCDAPPDTLELFNRFQRHQQFKWKQRLLSPLALRVPLWNPEQFLQRFVPWVRPLFGWQTGVISVLMFAISMILAAVHWTELSEHAAERVLEPSNLLLLWFIYPIMKAFHELGHAFAAKVWGGEVNEMGISFLVFTPVPYVDASSSSAFPEKHRRVAVAAAGMVVELFLASLALIIWLNVEPGIVRSIAFNVLLIGGVSTLVFNGNPLLRFDGYFILSDLIEIQSLASRSTKFYGYLCQRFLLGLSDVVSPATARGEASWFLGYGICAYIYRFFVVIAIIFFIAEEFFAAGVLLAVMACFSLLILPLKKIITFLVTDPRVQNNRLRALTVSASFSLWAIASLFFIPLPLYSISEGVVWLPERSMVRSSTDGFVEAVLVPSNTEVNKGDPLLRCNNPLLDTEIKIQKLRIRELEAEYTSKIYNDRLAAERAQQELSRLHAELDRNIEKYKGLTILSPVTGLFVFPNGDDVIGQFVKQGDQLGYLINRTDLTARTVVSEEDIERVRHQTEGLEIKFAENLSHSYAVDIKRELPAATDQLPSKALSPMGGGHYAVNPQEKNGITSLNKYFLIDINLPDGKLVEHIGSRVYVRFDHGNEFLIKRVVRSVRQLLLRRLDV